MAENYFWKVLLLRLICAVYISILWVDLVKGYVGFLGVFPLFIEWILSSIQISKKSYKTKIRVEIQLLRKEYVFLIIVLISIFSFPLYIEPIMKYQAERNKPLLKRIVHDLIKNCTKDIEKTKAILSWFDKGRKNINNVWDKELLLGIYPLQIYLEKPYICIRLIEHKYPLWVLTSRCGACGEYSLLFREMAHSANLTVRSVHNPGIDHNWDEILINGKWIIVDPVRVDLSNNSTGFNYSISEYKRIVGKYYIFAEYPNGSREDISYRYVNLANISFKVIAENGRTLSNVTIRALSYNLENKILDTKLECVTDVKGTCVIRIGKGDYIFLAKTDGLFPLYNETRMSIEENKTYNITLILKRDLLKLNIQSLFGQIIYISLFCLFCFSLLLYLELLRISIRS